MSRPKVKAAKLIGLLCLGYVAIVGAFESMLGTFQPGGATTLVITTTDEDGATHERVLARLESNGQLFVAANHWPRAWYRRTLENPSVGIRAEGVTGTYVAVPATDSEYDRVNGEHGLEFVFKILTGFPPRRLLRLEPE